jgi:hypothetical protein
VAKGVHQTISREMFKEYSNTTSYKASILFW